MPSSPLPTKPAKPPKPPLLLTTAPTPRPHSLAPPPLSTNTKGISNTLNVDFSTPSSASSTSFQYEWPPPDASAANLSHLAGAVRRPEDIEMDSIAPAGHRRRRSTLTAGNTLIHSPATTPTNATAGRSARPRAPSVRNPANPAADSSSSNSNALDAKISEEIDDGDVSPRRPADEYADDDYSDEDLQDDEEMGLTRQDKKRKQAKRRRNTRLDNRIAREKLSDEERREADRNVVRKLVINGCLILLWYLFSLSISLYNKWMFDSSKLNFAFPLFTTSMHMLVQFSLASLVLYFIPSLRPGNASHSSDLGRSRHETEPDRPYMSKLFYLTRIGPCGAATGLDIGLGNTSLKFITLTFYTMCKSSSLAFVLIFAFLFRLESPTWKLVSIIATMTMGVVMMVAGEVEFQLGGFVLVISAAFFSGFRWGLTQILLLRNPATSNPFSSIFFLAPIMFLTLILIAVPVEGFFELIEGLRQLSEQWGAVRAPLILLFPGTIAFLMTASEFALLQRSSVVTLSIAGIFKEVVTISAAAVVFDDKLTAINIVGLVITIAAIGAYNYIKLSAMRRDAQVDTQARDDAYTAAGASSSSEEESEEEAGLLNRHSEDREPEANLFTTDGDIIPAQAGEDAKLLRSQHND